ncbi:DUF7793 family protein [Arthrobacter sp. 31Y]|uniref:DUF7793 family protein n=1 Tax=Arthrobacter sp. 31Y TaxID=1115632 RepID=UPI0004B34F55|nr:STAS/SEC14 domain-containing protein [Arthrobacter sp. 31Y]
MDEHGVLQLKWTPNTIIQTSDAEAAMQMVNEMCGNTVRPLLVDMATTTSVSRGARAVFAQTCQASRIALLGASPVDKVIVNFVLAMNNSTRPKRFFTSRMEAMEWLKAPSPPEVNASPMIDGTKEFPDEIATGTFGCAGAP